MSDLDAFDLPDQCGYCGWRPIKEQGWRRTPHGRPYCPDCRAIPYDYQRSNGWSR